MQCQDCVLWCGLAYIAWRGVEWRGVEWRGVAWSGVVCCEVCVGGVHTMALCRSSESGYPKDISTNIWTPRGHGQCGAAVVWGCVAGMRQGCGRDWTRVGSDKWATERPTLSASC